MINKTELMHKFNLIGTGDNNKEIFTDIFSEFLNELLDSDLSDVTINQLYNTFIKDTNKYFDHKCDIEYNYNHIPCID